MSTYGDVGGRSRRVAPIRNARKRTWQKAVWPAFKLVVALALAGCALYWVGSKVSRPFTLLSRETKDIREISGKLRDIRSENEGLRRGIVFMDTPEGKAQAGRWSGLVKKGERRLLIPEDSTQPPSN